MSEPAPVCAAVSVLFDLDGTLLDLPVDIEPVRREIAALLAQAGWQGPASPLLAVIDRAARAAGRAGADDVRRAARAILERAELAAAPQARARAGAAALVSHLAGRGAALAIVTNQSRACVAPALAAAGLPRAVWHQVVSRDDVTEAKPDPEGMVRAARALAPAGGALAMVGDSASDVHAARAAARLLGSRYRLVTVAVQGGRSPASDLAAAAADHVVADLERVAALL